MMDRGRDFFSPAVGGQRLSGKLDKCRGLVASGGIFWQLIGWDRFRAMIGKVIIRETLHSQSAKFRLLNDFYRFSLGQLQ